MTTFNERQTNINAVFQDYTYNSPITIMTRYNERDRFPIDKGAEFFFSLSAIRLLWFWTVNPVYPYFLFISRRINYILSIPVNDTADSTRYNRL